MIRNMDTLAIVEEWNKIGDNKPKIIPDYSKGMSGIYRDDQNGQMLLRLPEEDKTLV